MREPIVLVALESARLSKEGIFDFLFGKKKEDETPSMKRLEKLEEEIKQLKAGPGLDVLSGKVKPDQVLLDKLSAIADKHPAPSMIYKQNAHNFEILCRLVQLPPPSPYSVAGSLDESKTASEAKKIIQDYIKTMEPQVKLVSTAKKLKVSNPDPSQLLDDVIRNYQQNWAFIKKYCYADAKDHRTHEAAVLAQDFGYPCGSMGNRDSEGLEALYDENRKAYEQYETKLEEIADEMSVFEECWNTSHGGKEYFSFVPAYDDVEFLVHARCALLDYVLKLKVSKEDLERADLLEGIKVASEAVSDLSVLSAAMNSGANDTHFGKYNFPLYSNQVKAICRKLQVAPVELSTESISVSASKVRNLQSVVEATLAELQKKVS